MMGMRPMMVRLNVNEAEDAKAEDRAADGPVYSGGPADSGL